MTTPARKRLILFTRFPFPGAVKTRLIPALGAEGAAGLHRRLVLRTLRTARKVCEHEGAELEVQFEGPSEEAMRHWLGDDLRVAKQSEGDLGARMANAFEATFRDGSLATIIIGSDCPALTPDIIAAAFSRLGESPAVFGPATDGGYYLIGLRFPIPELFQGIPWSTERVLEDSLRVLSRKNLAPALLEPLDDLDRPDDLAGWDLLTQKERENLNRVSVIIPALNEERQIGTALRAIQHSKPHQIIVVDGGSSDETLRIAREHGAHGVLSKAGRARQMNAGAAHADGGSLLFLHVDTIPPAAWMTVVAETLRKPGVAGGAFRLQIDGQFAGKHIIEWSANLRSRWLQLPYGDQGLFVARSLFETLGGFADLPIMEDYEMVRRLRRFGKIVTLSEPARTSGRRWERLGALRTTLTNQLMLAGYYFGVSPRKLLEFYSGRRSDR